MSNSVRYFTVLPNIMLTELDGSPARDRQNGAPISESHVKFIRERCVDPAYVSDTPFDPNTVHWTMPALVSAQSVIAKTASAKPGDIIELAEEDWQRLKRSVEKGVTYAPIGAMSCIPFMRAIMSASMTRPQQE